MAKYSKPQLAIVNATGLELDRETGVYFGKIGGYSALLRLLSNQYLMSFSVARNGMQPSAADMQVAVTGCEALQSCNVQGTRVNFYIKSGMTQKKTVENLGTAAGYLQAFFQQNGFVNCCESTFQICPTECYSISGNPMLLSEAGFQTLSERAMNEKIVREEKPENLVAGIVGALLGSLAGAVALILISRLGYISMVSGLVMGVCTVKLYEKFAGKVSVRGAIICVTIMIQMTYIADRIDWAIILHTEAGYGLFEGYRALPEMLKYEYIEKSSYYTNLALEYLFTALGAAPSIITAMRENKISGTSRKMVGLSSQV